MSDTQKQIVTRFAPSPTGFMHVGGIRTALYAWAFARKNKGTFILRIEDTDKEREVAGSQEHIIESLKWLGITWDEGPDIGGPNEPYLQSERLHTYREYANKLIEKDLAYADPYTPEQVEQFRKQAETEGKPFLFRDFRPENPPVWDGTQPLRLKVKDIKKYEWHDLVRGNLSAGEEALDDFILIKSDGYPTYNFAHIIDDLLMGVTHIFRADEFISSTPKFLSLYDALEIKRPEFVTLPPILGTDGKKKLGKRDGAKDILEYRKEGYLPEAMINFLAFIGWNPGDERELFTPKEFVTEFSIERIQTGGAKFNEEKLDWINKEYIKRVSLEVAEEKIRAHLPPEIQHYAIISKIIPLIQERIVKWGDTATLWNEGELSYFFEKPEYEVNKLSWKEDPKEVTKQHLEKVSELLNTIDENQFTGDNIKSVLWDYATEKGRGNVLWPLRVALSGKDKSPDPFTLAQVVGKSETIIRVENAIKKLN